MITTTNIDPDLLTAYYNLPGQIIDDPWSFDECVARLQREPDYEPYECSDWEDEDEVNRLIERDGLWIYSMQVRATVNDPWQTIESIGWVIGELDSGYLFDFLSSAVEFHQNCKPQLSCEAL